MDRKLSILLTLSVLTFSSCGTSLNKASHHAAWDRIPKVVPDERFSAGKFSTSEYLSLKSF